MNRASPTYWLLLLVTIAFTLATIIQPRAVQWNTRSESSDALKILLGDSRRNLAFLVSRQADVAFHSGYYPTIFEQALSATNSGLSSEQLGHDEAEHEKETQFLNAPHDWIEAFGRNFRVTEHSHLEGAKGREILPYLKLSAELDPKRVETYTLASYWLRTKLGKVQEAEEFLRDGLRNNPNSYEILMELGNLYHESRQDDVRARNVWQLALNRWISENKGKKEQDLLTLEQISFRLASLEENAGNLEEAVRLLNLAKRGSPHPETIQAQIDDLKKRIGPKP